MKILTTLCLMSMVAALYAVFTVQTTPSEAFSAENVVRVRANIPKPVPYREKALEVAKATEMERIKPEIACLQQNIYFEARNQSNEARIAVAWVTLNRVNSPRYKNSICEVVYHGVHRNGVPVRNRCAFSWYCDGKRDTPPHNTLEQRAWEEAGEIAEHMIVHCLMDEDISCPPDPTHGALFYFNPKLADPDWQYTKIKTASIDDHDFYTYNSD